MKIINILLLQWLCVRLTKCVTKYHVEIISVNLMSDGSVSMKCKDNGIHDRHWFAIQYWILPMSGWHNDFVFINKKPKFIKLTNPK